MQTEYIQRLMKELESSGVKTDGSSSININAPLDIDSQIIEQIENITHTKFSDEQLDILRHHGDACILACAGSGKTTININLIAKRIKSGEIADVNKVIYTTYSKSGAEEMRERLDKLLNKLGINKSIQVRTIHSFFLQILRTFGVTADIIKEKDRSKYIREACKDAGFIPKDDDLIIVDNLLSYQVNNLLSDKKTINAYVNTLDELSVEQYSKIRTGYANRKATAGVIDYDDMQSYLYLWLCKFAKSEKPNEIETARQIRQYCRAMWTDFYIDEAQDVSKIQFAIIRAMITEPDDPNKLLAHLMFIGDDDQSIYTWRGGDPSIILSIGPTFNIRTFVLSTNYRCKSKIVEYAANGVGYNSSRYVKNMQSNIAGGEVRILPSSKDDLNYLSELAVNHIKWLKSQGTNNKDIAVLSRNNFHLAILSNMLLKNGIYCNMTDDMKLTNSYMYKDIKMLIDLCNMNSYNYNHNTTAAILWKLCRYMNASTAKVIASFQDNVGISLQDALGYIVKTYCNPEIDYVKKFNIPIQEDERLKYALHSCSSQTREDIKIIYDALICGDSVIATETLGYQYLEASAYLYKTADKARSIKGLVAYITKLVKDNGYESTINWLRNTEQFESGRMGIIGDKVTLTTIHSAKGREWKNVIMFACDNISQPSFHGITKMINDDISVADISANIEEERRLFYVGNTRAKENLLVITSVTPSIFVLEALGIKVNNTSKNNYDIIDMAQRNDWAEDYKVGIQEKIFNESSEYYYDMEMHKVRDE